MISKAVVRLEFRCCIRSMSSRVSCFFNAQRALSLTLSRGFGGSILFIVRISSSYPLSAPIIVSDRFSYSSTAALDFRNRMTYPRKLRTLASTSLSAVDVSESLVSMKKQTYYPTVTLHYDPYSCRHQETCRLRRLRARLHRLAESH